MGFRYTQTRSADAFTPEFIEAYIELLGGRAAVAQWFLKEPARIAGIIAFHMADTAADTVDNRALLRRHIIRFGIELNLGDLLDAIRDKQQSGIVGPPCESQPAPCATLLLALLSECEWQIRQEHLLQ